MSDLTPAAAIRTAVFSSAVPAAPAPAPPTPAAPTAPAIPVEPYSPAGLSPSHAAQMIEWEKDNLAKGKITPEEAARRFDARGATPEQRAPDTRTAEVKLLDQHFPAAKPENYFIRYGEPGRPAPPMTPALQTGEDQEIPLPAQYMPWLAAWRAIRPASSNPSLFPGQGYQQSITAAAVRLRWRDLRLILGITGLWNYDLRRTLASCLSNELHVDDVTIRAILNHSDGSALSHYCFKSFDSLTGPIQAYADWVWNLPGTIPEPEGRLDRPRVWDEDAELMEVPG